MQKAYQRINWENDPSTNTPLNEDNLNKMDYALDQIDNRVVDLYGYQDRVAQAEKNAKTSETNAKTSETNAKQSELKAKEYMERAWEATPDGYDALVLKVDSLDIKKTTDSTLYGSKHGGARLTKMVGNTVQNGTPSPSTPQPMYHTGDVVEMEQGWYNSANGEKATANDVIRTTNKIPCASGDVISITCDNISSIRSLYYLDNTFVSTDSYLSPANVTVPSGVNCFAFNIYKEGGITPQTVGKITLTINGKYVNVFREHGKNFFSYDKVTTTLVKSSARTGIIYANKNVTMPSGTYKIVLPDLSITNNLYSLSGRLYKLGGTTVQDVSFTKQDDVYQTSVTITEDITIGYISFFLNGSDNNNATATFSEIMIVKDDVTDDTYEPYTETVAYFLTEKPMMDDSHLFREDGLVKVAHDSIEKTYNGTESNWKFNTSGGCYAYTDPIANAKPSSVGMCNLMGSDGAFVKDNNFYINGGGYPIFCTDSVSSADEWKALISATPCVIKYKLATPYIEVLDTESQLALNSLKTFDNVTYLDFDSRVKPSEIEVEYGTSQVGAYTLQSLNNTEANAIRLDALLNTQVAE